MLSLNLPSYEIKIAERNGKNVIFDMLRKRYVALTPEEWVRQHFVHYLTDYKGYPKGLLANEIQLDLNGTKKRCDTVLLQQRSKCQTDCGIQSSTYRNHANSI